MMITITEAVSSSQSYKIFKDFQEGEDKSLQIHLHDKYNHQLLTYQSHIQPLLIWLLDQQQIVIANSLIRRFYIYKFNQKLKCKKTYNSYIWIAYISIQKQHYFNIYCIWMRVDNGVVRFMMFIQLPQIIIMLKRGLSVFAALSFSPLLMNQDLSADTKRHAICILYPNQSQVRGIVSFSQDKLTSPTKIACSIKGLNPNGKHGMHIHQFGDLTEGCATAGAHYNPHNKNHGGPFSQERHVGDLGNVMSDPFGNAYMCFVDKSISLYGQYSILGRSVVLHAKQDDLGRADNPQSLKTGNSGPRVACGVIGLSKQFKIVPPSVQ